jgi:hypothetical protein
MWIEKQKHIALQKPFDRREATPEISQPQSGWFCSK